MTIQQLLDLGENLAEMSDETLRGHLVKYFPQTRPIVELKDDGIDEELPDFLKDILRAENKVNNDVEL